MYLNDFYAHSPSFLIVAAEYIHIHNELMQLNIGLFYKPTLCLELSMLLYNFLLCLQHQSVKDRVERC